MPGASHKPGGRSRVEAAAKVIEVRENMLMAAVTRLLTIVDVDDELDDPRQMSVSARHEAVLADGQRVLLLDDRGWVTSALRADRAGEVPDSDLVRDRPNAWAMTSVEEIEETARWVVGPDEAEGHSQKDMEASHWAYLADVLQQQGVVVDAHELKRLPHDVVLSERLLARIGRGRGGTASA